MKRVLRWVLTVVMVIAGANHFISPSTYLGMMPAALPAPLALVYISGVAEIAGGLGLIPRATRKLAAWGLIALFLAVFPANLNMALNDLPLGTQSVPTWALWARLPLQIVFIAWAYWFTRGDGTRLALTGDMPNETETKPKKQYPVPPGQEDKDDDNVLRKELSKGDVRPDGPGDETAPVKPDVRTPK